jgi:hypothetical protein
MRHSASEPRLTEWLDPEFWERLERLEGQHERVQSEHENARRDLERLTPQEAQELQQAWQRYCEVVAQLDQTTGDFEALRTCPD